MSIPHDIIAAMRIMTRFLARRFLSSVMMVLGLVVGIIFAITFVEKLPGAMDTMDAAGTAAIAVLELIPLFLPMTVFLGTLLCSYNLTRSSEMVIVHSAGLSPYQSMRPYLLMAALLGILTTTLLNPYSVKLSNTDINSTKLVLVDNAIWLRETGDNGIIILRAMDMALHDDGIIFKKASIFSQNMDAQLTARIESDTVVLADGKFSTPRAMLYMPDGTMRAGAWSHATLLNKQTVLERYLKPNQISFWRLPHFIWEMQKMGVTLRGHLVQFWTLLFLPLSLVAMVVLGMAFSQTKQRRNYGFGIKFGIGIVVCFALYFIMNVFGALGMTGGLPTLLAVLAPPIIIIAGAALFIVSYDTI